MKHISACPSCRHYVTTEQLRGGRAFHGPLGVQVTPEGALHPDAQGSEHHCLGALTCVATKKPTSLAVP